MAAFQERGGSYRIIFRYHGKQHAFTLGKVEKDEAENKARQVNYLLMRLKQRLITLPEDTDIVTFVEHDGKPPTAPAGQPIIPRQTTSLVHLKDRFLVTLGNGAIEANSLDTCKIHLRHFCRFFGDAFPLPELTVAKLQDFVNKRSKDGVSPVTIKKELSTLRAAWNWAAPMKLTSGSFPNKGLRFPKTDEKPGFMTRSEIERQLESGGDADQLWNCLYLQIQEIAALLAYVKAHALHPWIHPLFAVAAHTGVRRSELLRILVSDVDFTAGTLLIREKKRSRGHRTTRRVPLTPFLRSVLADWLKAHPGGQYLFCHCGIVERSKKRSLSTGHENEKTRPSSQKERTASVHERRQQATSDLTRNEVHDHFKRTLAESKWDVMRGLHCLRHSFISACASKGVDQRLIDEWVGHQTEQQRKRYRHLYPSTQQEAIKLVFC